MYKIALLAVALGIAAPALAEPARNRSHAPGRHGIVQRTHGALADDLHWRRDGLVRPPPPQYMSTFTPLALPEEGPVPSAYNRCGACGSGGGG